MGAEIRSSTFITSDGVRLRVLETVPRGPAGALANTMPVVAFVPGWSMPANIWQPQLAAIGAGRRVAALDPRGQGESEIPARGFDIERRAADVRDFVARYDRVVLVGWSLGALEALQCVHRYGDARLEALVLVDSSVGEDSPPAPATRFIEALQQDRRATIIAFVREMFSSSRTALELDALVDAALRMPLDASLSLFPRGIPREHWRDIARRFSKPLLYVVTEQFAAQARSLLQNRPGTRIAVFEAAGHALFVDEPDRFNQLLVDFFEEMAAAARGVADRP
ncbi:MAG: alpha/beta hydrolase [Betaproteobacteria bacterium]|nr:MAG: alpha/beta hydrolase [Betaproteobacteria bacterium]